jgi:hypothetical protein
MIYKSICVTRGRRRVSSSMRGQSEEFGGEKTYPEGVTDTVTNECPIVLRRVSVVHLDAGTSA